MAKTIIVEKVSEEPARMSPFGDVVHATLISAMTARVWFVVRLTKGSLKYSGIRGLFVASRLIPVCMISQEPMENKPLQA